MRTVLIFGFLIGALQAGATLIIHAFGLYSAPELLEGAHRFENIASFVAMTGCLALGLYSAQRTLAAGGGRFTVGFGATRTLGIATVGCLVAGLAQYLYVTVVNPAYSGHLRTVLLSSAKIPEDQIGTAQAQLDFVTSALFRGLAQGASTFFFSLLIGLAYTFIFREPSAPAAPTAPPASPEA